VRFRGDRLLRYKGLTGALLSAALLLAPAARAAEPAAVAPPAVASAASPAKPDHSTIRPDPAVRVGVLPNGMRYLLMRNANPKGAVALRFAIDVGSYEETEAERGFAHFIEHMAFRSTRNFPEGAPDKVFAGWGVAFGRDQNAATELFSTTFQLDMPKPDDAQLKTGLGWLREAADGIVFTDAAISRERGVVLAEMEARSSPQQEAQEAIARFQGGKLRSVNRSPIGTRATLDAANPVSMKRFYDSWYRPEHGLVTIVGDRSLDELEALVKATFGDWKGRGPKPARAAIVPPPAGRPRDAFSIAGPTYPLAVSVCHLGPGQPRAIKDVAGLRRASRAQIWQEILNRRFAQIAADGDKALLGGAVISSDQRDAAITCIIAMPVGDDWEAALKVAQAEVNRFSKDGPTEIEAESATELLRSRFRGAVMSATAQNSSNLADTLLGKALAEQAISSPPDALYAYDLAVEDLTPEDIRASFNADWTVSAPLISLTGPKPIARTAVLAAWEGAASTAPSERYADRALATWGYTSFGKAGKVVQRTEIADPGFSRLTFDNGVVLNFKQTSLEPNKVEIRLVFGSGRRDVKDSDFIATEFGSSMLIAGGTGKHSFEDIQTMFASRTHWSFQLGMGAQTFGMGSTAFSESTRTQLQILAAYMSDPGFRRTVDARLPTSLDLIYRSYLSDPTTAATVALVDRVDPSFPGRVPPRDVLMAMKSADFERALKPVLTTSPVELAIVGDISEEDAVRAVATTFGALPARPARPMLAPEPHFMRYPDEPLPPIRTIHEGPANKAAAILVWPLYVSTPERRSEEYTLKLLAAVFDTAFRRRAREDLGKTYSPSVETTGPDFGDQGALQVTIDAEPQDIDKLTAEARAVAARLVAGEITPKMLEDAREPILANARARKESNDWWADSLAGSAKLPAILEEGLLFEPLMSAITLDQVKQAAVRWLSRDPIVATAVPASAAKAKGARP
jgi:zinc protease